MAGKVVDVTLRLIDKMSSPLNKMGGTLANSSRQWTKAGKDIEKAGKNISKVGTSLTKSVTAPIVGAGAACVKLASDFEAGMSKVQSISGATGKELEALEEKAKEMGAKTKFSATESTEAFSYMAMAGWKTKEMLDGIEGVMYLAGATGEDLASTSDIVTDALTAFGMKASDTSEFVDVLAQTANQSNTNVSMLGESFKYVAPVAGSLKFNVQDISTALGLMANNGIKASTAGTSLRSWLSRMASPTDAVQAAMDKLGISLTDSEGNMKDFATIMTETRKGFAGLSEAEKAATASALAGKTGMSGLLAIVNSSDKDFESLSKAIYDSNGACKEMYDVANDNLQGQLTILKSTVESLAISFGERLVPYVKRLTSFLQGLAERFNGLSEAQKDMIVKVALVAAAVGPALLAFGKMVLVVGKVVSIVGKLGTAFKVFGSIGAMIASPVGIAIAVVAGLIAVGVLLYKNWDKVKVMAGKCFKYVKSVFKELGMTGDSMKKKLQPISEHFQRIWVKMQELWVVSQPILKKIADVWKLYFQVKIGAIIGATAGVIKSFIESGRKMLAGVMTAFEGLIDFLTGVFTGNWKKAWHGVRDIFKGVFQSLVAFAKAPLNTVIGLINGVVAGINKMKIEIPDWVPKLGGKNFSVNVPEIPALAVGTQNWGGGLAQISEKGGEIVDLPRGSRVYPHDESVKRAYTDGAKSGSKTVNINIPKLADKIEVRSDEDIDKLAAALANKLEKISLNLGGEEIEYSY